MLISLICSAFAGCEQGKAPADDTVKETTQETPTEAPESRPEETDFVEDVVYGYPDTIDNLLKKWNYVIKDKKISIESIDLRTYSQQMDVIIYRNEINITGDDVCSLLDIISGIEPKFTDKYGKDATQFKLSHLGDAVIEVYFIDQNKAPIFGICIYPNGDTKVCHNIKELESLGGLEYGYFTADNIYQKIDEIYTRVCPEKAQKESDTE